MNKENFITIQGWMRTDLNLKGNDLLVYAIIYGFSQSENQKFTGSLQYLADWCGATKQGIMKNLKNLMEMGLIQKNDIVVHGVNSVEYHTTQLNGVLNSVEWGIKLSLPNNIDNKQNNNINNNSKELLLQKSKKPSLYDKCVADINSRDYDEDLRMALMDYLQVRLQIKDKPLYANSWKGLLNKLERDFTESERIGVVFQSIERGYASFFPVNSGWKTKEKPWESGVTSERYTEKEKEDMEKWQEDMRKKGLQVDF